MRRLVRFVTLVVMPFVQLACAANEDRPIDAAAEDSGSALDGRSPAADAIGPEAASGDAGAIVADGAPCTDGGAGCLIVLATGEGRPAGIAVDSRFVYWADKSNDAGAGAVKKAPIGGGPITVLATGRDPSEIVIDATTIYWTDFADGKVLMAPLSGIPGGGPGTVVAANEPTADAIAIDEHNLYWTVDGAIRQKALAGATPPQTISPAMIPEGVISDGTYVYFTDDRNASPTAGAVYRVPVGGAATPTLLAAGLNRPDPIVLSGSLAYVGTMDALFAIPITETDGGVVVKLAEGATISGLAIAGPTAYWTEQGAGNIDVGTIAPGGTPERLLGGLVAPHGLAVDARNVYFADITSGVVAQISR